MQRKTFLRAMIASAALAAMPLATWAQDTIKIGEINHYKRLRDDQGEPGEAVKIAEELMTRDGAVMLTGTILSNVGLAISSFAGEKGYVYLASEPLADSLVWGAGNKYTFRLRSSTFMQAAMLAEAAAKTDAKRFATIAPNYAYGKDAVAAFKENLLKLKPDAEFVAEQWPALFKIDAAPTVACLKAATSTACCQVSPNISTRWATRPQKVGP